MKKSILSSLTLFVLTGLAFAQEAKVSFENKISSDVVSISKEDIKFAGIKEQVTAEVETSNVDLGVSFITYLEKDENENLGFTAYDFDKAYIEFRPTQYMALDFNRKVFLAGSYLPVFDDNLASGNMTSDFSMFVKPLENLKIAAGTNVPSVFADVDDKIDLCAAAEYTTNLFSLGATLRNPITNLEFGIYTSFTGIKDLMLNAGFAYNDDFLGNAANLLIAGATYKYNIFNLAYDFVTNFGKEGTDLYTALLVETAITENLTIETQATLKADFEDSDANSILAEAGAAYEVGNHKIRAGIAVDFADSINVAFPVYYKYSF